jgi:hypothetical protein
LPRVGEQHFELVTFGCRLRCHAISAGLLIRVLIRIAGASMNNFQPACSVISATVSRRFIRFSQ